MAEITKGVTSGWRLFASTVGGERQPTARMTITMTTITIATPIIMPQLPPPPVTLSLTPRRPARWLRRSVQATQVQVGGCGLRP